MWHVDVPPWDNSSPAQGGKSKPFLAAVLSAPEDISISDLQKGLTNIYTPGKKSKTSPFIEKLSPPKSQNEPVLSHDQKPSNSTTSESSSKKRRRKKKKNKLQEGSSGPGKQLPVSQTSSSLEPKQQKSPQRFQKPAPSESKQQKPQKKPSADPKKQTKRPIDIDASDALREESPAAKKSKLSDMQENMKEKLKGGKFRWLNEKLYTSSSQEAANLIATDPSLGEMYHDGFRSQVSQWPVNPVDKLIGWLEKQPHSLVVGDFGCGEAKIGQTVSQTVYSFDLYPANEYVTACDISEVPLPEKSLDVAIFCLSLMGVNFMDFLAQAHRVLKKRGILKITEVKSRFPQNDYKGFIEALKDLGFDQTEQDDKNPMFVEFTFLKSARPSKKQSYSLSPCIYKRR